MTDIHAYRTAIDPRCRIGVCSVNNCIYPYCIRQGDFVESQEIERRILEGVDLVADTGILNSPTIGEHGGRPVRVAGDHARQEVPQIKSVGLEGPCRCTGKGPDLFIIDDVIPDQGDHGALAQEHRKSRWHGFLDSVSTKALCNIRR